MEVFDEITRKKPAEVTVASIKGGRFKELARYNLKGVIRPAGGNPNQIGIGFNIDGKKNYVNLFSSGVVRFTGASDSAKVIHFIERYTGKLEVVTFSNLTGQVRINKELNLEKLADSIRSTRDIKVSRNRNNITVHFSSTTEERVVRPRVIRHQVAQIGLASNEYNVQEKHQKLFSISFFKSGIIQYKGKYVDVGIILNFIHVILKPAQLLGNVFIGAAGVRAAPEKKVVQYKTRSTNPPDPPDSFEGKCQPGYYCRPNAQGFPTCYKIPKINESSRKTVIEAYKGLTMPESVRRLFGIKELKKVEKPVDIVFEKQTVGKRVLDILKIGGRQCSRLTEDQLEDVARRNQIPGVKKGMGIAKMCGLIGASIKKQEVRSAFTLEGVKYYVEGERIRGAPRSNGKPNPGRKCDTIPTATLYKYAKAMGIDVAGKSKPQICKEMREKKQPARVVVVPEVPEEVKEVAVDKRKQRFLERIGTTPYTNKNYKEWLLAPTPTQKAKTIIRIKRLALVNSLETGPFRQDLLEYAQTHSEKQIIDYLEKLKTTYKRLEKPTRAEHRRDETEIM